MKIPNFLTKTRNKILAGIVIIIVIVSIFAINGEGPVSKNIEITKGNVEQLTSVSGRVASVEDIDLAFDRSGKLISLPVKVNQKVYKGQMLAMLEIGELSAQRQRELANVSIAQTKLDQLEYGARFEDIEIIKTNVEGARETLKTVREKNSIDTASSALNSAINSIVTLSSIINRYPDFDYNQKSLINGLKEEALFIIYGQRDLGKVEPWYFLKIDGGLKSQIESSKLSPEGKNVDWILGQTKKVLVLIDQAFNSCLVGLNLSPTSDADKTLATTTKTGILTYITAISNQEQAIITAQNNLNNLQSQLELKTAPPTNFDLEITKAQLEQAKANLALIDSQISKNIIRSPINGLISNIDGKIGEIVTPNKFVVSVIGGNKYQIEANVPEVDVARIAIGNKTVVSLDAYGPDIFWEGQVVQIYPAERIVEGVPTYKTVIELDKEDSKIKSGMTANLDIKNQTRNDVLVMPQRAIIRKDGKKLVRLIVDENEKSDPRLANAQILSSENETKYIEVEIETDLQGSDGKIEILSGLKQGDKVLTE